MNAILAQVGLGGDIDFGRAIELWFLHLVCYAWMAIQFACGIGWCISMAARKHETLEFVAIASFWCVWLVAVIAVNEGALLYCSDLYDSMWGGWKR